MPFLLRTTMYICIVSALLACGSPSSDTPEDPDHEMNVAPDPTEVSFQPTRADILPYLPQRPSLRVQTPVGDVVKTWAWPDAAVLANVNVVSLWDSVTVFVPWVEGVKDYRAFVLHDGLSVASSYDKAEMLENAVMYCAGFRQANDKATSVRPLLQMIEVAGVKENDLVVVEALDQPCPFVGPMASQAKNLAVSASAKVDVPAGYKFSVYTEKQVKALYKNVVVNGHARGAKLAQPASLVYPHVLARTTLVFHASDKPAPTAFFDGFTDATDQPVFVENIAHPREQGGQLWQNSAWSFYVYNHDFVDMHIQRGQLDVVLADWQQEIFASVMMYPKKPVSLSDEGYVKAVFDVDSNATQRRYWWLSLCGASVKGATMDNGGRLKSPVIQTPFFYQPDGRNPSVAGWNCLQVFPRDGSPFPLGSTRKRTQSDVRVMLNRPGCGGLQDCAEYRSSVVNVSPSQYGTQSWSPAPGWYRQQNAQGLIGDTVLDDQMLVSPKTRYVFYISRSRVVMYVNGQQRVCNNFAKEKLSMAEGALGFGQVLYHSSAERVEFTRSFNDRTGQYYYLENTPFLDVRSWDNMGYSEGSKLPESFDETLCYTYQ